MKRNSPLSAFTLVEMSIVLVIIGLLVGGVLAGSHLIKTAQIRSVIKDFDKINLAANAFINKYDCIPGDCSNATDFGFSANGNGNNLLSKFESIPTGYSEVWQFYKQLGEAKFLAETYSGVSGTSGGGVRHAIPGQNVMKSKIPNAGYTVVNWGGYTSGAGTGDFSPTSYTDFKENSILFGTPDTTSAPGWTYETYMPALIPIDAYYIDSKVDDGKPGTGNIVSLGTSAGGCTDTDVKDTAKYRTTSNTIACGLITKVDFQN